MFFLFTTDAAFILQVEDSEQLNIKWYCYWRETL